MNEEKYRLLINIQIAADELENSGWNVEYRTNNGTPKLKELCIFNVQSSLCSEILYFVPSDLSELFPADKYCYVSGGDIKGDAPHIYVKEKSDNEIINKMLEIFQKYKDFEVRLSNTVMNGGSLLDLCEIGTRLFSNPVYVHDRFFSVLALPKYEEGMLKFEEGQAKGSLHIPLWLINEFKFDEAYQRTLLQKNAGIWDKDHYPYNIRSLYVNLFDNELYCGRLLINEIETPLRNGQLRTAEIFAQYVRLILLRDKFAKNRHYKDYENVMEKILKGDAASYENDIADFLEIQGWNKDDEYLCIKFQTQDESLTIQSDGALRSLLTNKFKDCFDFYCEQRLCLLINLSKSNLKIAQIRASIAELVRDSYMYCGISNKIQDFADIYSGFLQADIALQHTKENKHQWIQMFIDCGLNYILRNTKGKLDTQFMISPYPALLKRYDEQNGSDYYKTLKSYIVNERNIPKTSEDLVIHRTTLTHRLEQMQKIIKPDLENEEVRLYLLLSFKLYEQQ